MTIIFQIIAMIAISIAAWFFVAMAVMGGHFLSRTQGA